MEFVNNLGEAWIGRVPTGPAAGPRAHPDWFGLRARLDAAYCARRALLDESARAASRRGSFGRGASAALATLPDNTLVINPNDLGDGKPHAGKESEVAVRTDAATRECCDD
jgi:hypothetical protein